VPNELPKYHQNDIVRVAFDRNLHKGFKAKMASEDFVGYVVNLTANPKGWIYGVMCKKKIVYAWECEVSLVKAAPQIRDNTGQTKLYFDEFMDK